MADSLMLRQDAPRDRYRLEREPAQGDMARRLRACLGAGVLLAVAAAAPVLAQCPDGTPPPCGAPPLSAYEREGLAIFPFRATTGSAAEWSEAIPDLLAATLDGTPGVRVADPWALWQPLRPALGDRAQPPGPAEAAGMARGARTQHYVLGSVTQVGSTVNVTVRVYRRGRGDPLRTVASAHSADSLAAIVGDVRMALLSLLAGADDRSDARSVGFIGTRSPDALQEFLRAREALRRGRLAEAEAAIDRALALDSTFARALVTATRIKSWTAWTAGLPYRGLMELLERAIRHLDSLPTREALRARASLASARTEGARCAALAEAIIRSDSGDVDAWDLLRYCDGAYGWQYGRGERDILRGAERVVQLDPGFFPGVAARALLAVMRSDPDPADVRRQLQRLRHIDSTGSIAGDVSLGLRAVIASDRDFPEIVDAVASGPVSTYVAVMRSLRASRPDRAERLVRELRDRPESQLPSALLTGSWAQLLVAEGRGHEVEAARSQLPDTAQWAHVIDRLLVAAGIAGTVDSSVAGRAVARLARGMPVDSAAAYISTRPVWRTGWLLGAHHARWGDTTVARRWRDVLGAFPAGGATTVPEWPGALMADLDARLAARASDRPTALAQARRAYALWNIHAENVLEADPEPAMRFHLALLHRDFGNADSAEALLRSLTVPTTWMGVYTARADFEIAELAAARGDRGEAERRYRAALALWSLGGTEAAQWRSRAAAGLRQVANSTPR